MKQTEERVIEILKNNIEELNDLELTSSMQLISSGYIDSFDIINIIGLLEQEFHINIDLEDIDLEQFDTVESICEILAKKS